MTIRVLSPVMGICLMAAASLPAAAQDQDIARFRIPDGAKPDPEIGITLPPGFTATIFHEGVGPARHLAVSPSGDLYVKLRKVADGGGIVALRDTDGDGRADEEERFGDFGGTAIMFHDGALYAASDVAVFRYQMDGYGLAPAGEPEVIVEGFPEQKSHAAKAIAFDDEGNLYVAVGAPSNACQEPDRKKGVKGQNPCPDLERQAGVWRYDANKTGQKASREGRFATGLRHIVGIAWNGEANALFAAVHGRDQLDSLWPEHFTAEQNAELPAEEFVRIAEGDDFGWPYAYYDPRQKARMIAPEYGGDGKTPAEKGKYRDPVLTFPAHWAPNALLFYTGQQFPAAFRHGAFVAFHGSWNRSPQPQGGYNVVFVPFKDGAPTGEWQVFAERFAGAEKLNSSADARYRPVGLAQGLDGSLYIAESITGRIWKVTYGGQADR